MGLIVCSCKDPACKTHVIIGCANQDTVELWITNKYGEETLMYMDANTVVALVQDLQVALTRLVGAE